MSVAATIKRTISNYPVGQVFDYCQVTANIVKEQAAVKVLSRMVQSGELFRVEKGKYYKQRQNKFGKIRPAENEIVKMVTEKNNRKIGYLTGLSLYNKLGLTTQVSNSLQIARQGRLPAKQINNYRIKFVTTTVRFSSKDILLVQILDALKNIKQIPDTTINASVLTLQNKLTELSFAEITSLIKLCLQYNPSTRALTGAILQNINSQIDTTSLKQSLNSLSKYKLNIATQVLPNKSDWNIV